MKKENKAELKDEKTDLIQENQNTEQTSNEMDEKIKEEKVNKILKKAKENGKITYGELASELDDVNPEQMDKVFDAFEKLGVDVLKDDFEAEPDFLSAYIIHY